MEDNFLERIMELGIGLSMARQMPDLMSQSMQAANPQMRQGVQQPPQIPQETVWYLVVDNAQAGPFNEEALKQIIRNNLIKPDTLVWRSGMAKWMPANSVPEVNKLFLLAKI
ncbi:MAG: DUF4339 domain-containing protein [Bacteroidales bacterium]|nr:DUF4339 domain-containing protein [Bacteroidales bacterium]